jgi:hypothetical protein
MNGKLKRKIMIGVAVVAVLAGGILAIVTASGKGPSAQRLGGDAGVRGAASPSDLALAASYLDLSRAQLRHALRAGSALATVANATRGKSAPGLIDALFTARAARLSAGASSGKLSAAERASRLAKLRQRVAVEVYRYRGVAVGPLDLAAAARYLGLTSRQLRRERQPGRSLAQIANASKGRSAAGLIRAMVSAKATALEGAVKAGKLSQAAAAARVSKLPGLMSSEVDYVPLGRASKRG